MCKEKGVDPWIEIDGGASGGNAKEIKDAGCNAIVAGSAVFNAPVLCGCCEGHQGSIERPEIRKVLRNAIRLCKKLIDFWWFVDQNDDFGPFFPSQPVSPEAGDIGIRPALCRIWRDRRWKPSFVSAGSARWSFYKVLTGEKGDALLQQSGFADSAKPRAARAADKMM